MIKQNWILLCPSRETKICPGLVDHNCYRIRKIKTSVLCPHWQAQYIFLTHMSKNFVRKSSGFRSKKQCITKPVFYFVIQFLALCRTGKQAYRSDVVQKFLVGSVLLHIGPFVIIQSCASQRSIIESESQGVDQMKFCSSVCTKTYNIPCIWWNLGLIEDNMDHGKE